MNYWYYFWISWLFLAGTAFAVMAVIVMIGGISDLRQMFSRLTHRSDSNDSPSSHV
jgi:hypothetical protein